MTTSQQWMKLIRRECPPDKSPTLAFTVYIMAMAHGPDDMQLSDTNNYEMKYKLAVLEMRNYMQGSETQIPKQRNEEAA